MLSKDYGVVTKRIDDVLRREIARRAVVPDVKRVVLDGAK